MSTTSARISSKNKSKSNSDYSSAKKSSPDSSTSIAPVNQQNNTLLAPNHAVYSAPAITSPVQMQFIQFESSEEDAEDKSSNETGSVQMMCPECKAEQDQQDEGTVQQQTEEEGEEEEIPPEGEETAETEAPDVTAEESKDAVQMMCPECEAETEQQGEETVQQQAGEDTEEETPEEAGSNEAVQMWSCGDYPEPTCSIQEKADTAAPVQFMCPECEAETEQQGKDTVQQQTEEEGEEEKPQKENTVQQKSNPAGSKKPSVLHIANQGLRNAKNPLPHQERIQASFGRHDISNVRSEVGGAAGHASRNMGALAYTSGDRIGFRHPPGLHLAAHEAAHTVQQRSGLKLPGNVGRAGDKWEQHADQVADTVVAGKSAEPLLDKVSPPSSAHLAATTPANGDGISGAVQHRLTTSTPTHRIEPPHISGLGAGVAEEGEAESEPEETTGGETEAGAENVAGVEETVEANEEEANDPTANCEAAQGQDEEEENPCDQPQRRPPPGAESGEQNTAPPEKGRCYEADVPDPPPGSEEPSSDAPQNDVEEESDVSCGDWEEANDECECAARDQMQQQTGIQQTGESLLSAEVSEFTPAETAASAGGSEATPEAGGEGGETSEGGGGEGGQEGAAVAGTESSFGSQEASRDAAIAEYMAANREVARIPDRTLNLSKDLRFSNAASGSAADDARRAMALKQIRSFMLRANAQIQSAVDFVSTTVPARLGGMAESVKANIDMSMLAEKSLISDRIEQARNTAIDQAANARNAINADYESSVAIVNEETDAAIEGLTETHLSSTDSVNTRETESLGEINVRFQNGRDAHDTKGDTYANRAIATGQSWVTAYDKCRKRSGNDWEYNGDDGFFTGCLTVRRAKAQQDAACKAASGTAKNMKKEADKKGYKLREQRTQFRCAVISGAGQSISILDTTLERLTSGLESGRAGTLSGLAQARDMNLQAVEGALAGMLQSLDQQETQQRQAVNDAGYVQQVAVDQMAHKVAAGLAGSVSAAMESLEGTLAQLREQLTEGDAPPPDVLNDALAAAEKGLGGGVGTLLDKMEEGASNAETQIRNAGTTAATALQDVTTGNDRMASDLEQNFETQMIGFVDANNAAMSQLTERQVQKAQESYAQGTDSMQQVVTGFIDSTEQIYARVDSTIQTSLQELDTNLKGQEGGLEGKIAAEGWRAASKEQPAWKKVVAIILIIVIIVVSIVVSVLTAGAFGPVAAVLIGGIIGAITAGLIQIINNWAAGEEWDKGLLQAMVIGFAGGILGGAFGAGANRLASIAINRAIQAGASNLTRAAINLSINFAGDMLGEAASQAFNYFVFGQKFNWQGFVTAGGMSFLSTARGGVTGQRTPTGAAAHGATPRTPLHAPSAGDAAIGLGFGLAIEGVNVAAGGEFDITRLAQTAAGAGGASWASRRGNLPDTGTSPSGRTQAPEVEAPTTPRTQAPEAEAPTTPRTQAPEAEAPTTPRTQAPEAEAPTTPRTQAPEAEAPTTPRTQAPEAEAPTSPRTQAETPEGGGRVRTSGEGDLGTVNGRRVTGEVELPGNQRMRMLDDGTCVVCASPCKHLRQNFGPELDADPRLALRLQRIENSLAANPNQPRVIDAHVEIQRQLRQRRIDAPERIRGEFSNELRTRPDLAAELNGLQARIREKPTNQRLQRRLRALQNELNGIRATGTFVPQTTMKQRLDQTPSPNKGTWGGGRGDSKFVHNDPNVRAKLQEFGVDGITYRDGYPDFSPVTVKQYEVTSLGSGRPSLHSSLDARLALDPELPRISGGHFKPGQRVTATQVKQWRSQNKLTWHEHQNRTTVQLVPTIINSKFGHVGGFGEQNAMNASD